MTSSCYGGFLQFPIALGDPGANLVRVRTGLERLGPAGPGLIVLPELWATGFAYDQLPALAGRTPALLAELHTLARRSSIYLVGSLPEAEDGRFYNTLFVTGPEGTVGRYRKQHLFAPMAEDRHFFPGRGPRPIATPFGQVGGLVCYDLRFAELGRAQAAQGAWLFTVSAEWPAARLAHWRTLVQARAIENQAFVIACNSCGVIGETEFGGHSMIVAPDGAVLHEAGEEEEGAGTMLAPERVTEVRGRFNTAAPTPYGPPDRAKVVSLPELTAIRGRCRDLGRKVVFTNGCFDILHVGHVSYLEEARRQGDLLVVGLNSDASVRAIKGPTRPVNREADRARLLAALGCVDYVVLFAEETPQQLISTLLPDVLVKGADWPVERIAGAREVLAAGGRVANIALEAGFSTTGLIEKIKGEGPGC
ncbi:MAG: D-glycero-beta-D-manno-heptose 1-phosphate adenylyltransferase [Desulfobacteraceae bacterium]|nr:D-glycero-beta-D-manno-heptose 1-phosphate adenylyltransferase [Desulfobacteraceae bacterium]